MNNKNSKIIYKNILKRIIPKFKNNLMDPNIFLNAAIFHKKNLEFNLKHGSKLKFNKMLKC